MKKLLLAIAIMFLSLPCLAKEKIGDLFYNLYSSSLTAEVTYEKYLDYSNYQNLTGPIGIPETVVYNGKTYSVTSIEDYAFLFCRGLTSVVIPNSVKSIGEDAFSGCSGLTKSAYPSNLSNPFSYGRAIEYNCNDVLFEERFIYNSDKSEIYFAPLNLEGEFDVPDSVTSIGAYAFYRCSGLTSVTIPNSVTSIGWFAFTGCTGLRKVEISDLEAWCNIVFGSYEANPLYYANHLYLNGNEIKDLVIPSSVTSIGNQAFYGCSGLTSIEIGNAVASIGSSAFSGCSGLTSIEIPSSVTSIENYAFYGCSGLTSVEIPNSVASIGDQAFKNCSGLTSIEFNAINCTYCGSSEYPAFPSNITAVKIGEQVKNIPANAFKNCSGLTSIEIGNAVASIGSSAFSGCSGLTSIEIPSSVTSIGSSAFSGCSGLTSFEIPSSVTSIGSSAFSGCSGLTSFEIPSSVTSIGNSAFSGCNLVSLTLENQTPPDFYSVFSSYNNTATLNIPSNTYVRYLASLWRNFLDIRSNGEAIPSTFAQSDDVFEYIFLENEGKAILTGLVDKDMTSVSIPDRTVGSNGGDEKFYNVVAIGEDTFKGCSSMTQLKLPASLEFIGVSAFSDCRGIKGTLNIPSSVTSIGVDAFSGCNGLSGVEISDLEAWCNIVFGNYAANPLYYANHLYLNGNEIKDLVIPGSVTSIKNYAFYGCISLTSVEIPNSVASIGNDAFSDCISLTSVEIPNSVTSIGWWAFSDCRSLTNVEIPNSVTSIGYRAFDRCSGLKSVTIPNSVTFIGGEAFNYCDDLASLTLADGIEDLTFEDNSFDVSTLYLGRNLVGKYSFPKIESLTTGGFIKSIPSNIYNQKTLASVTINPGAQVVIEDGAFSGSSNLAELTLPEDITEIGANAFKGTALKNVTVPGGVIGDNAFANCNLDNIILGANVERIGEYAFDGSNTLKNVYATPTTPPAAQNNTFSYYEAQLWVPEEAIDTYYNNTRCWYRFNGKPLVCPENIEVTGPASFSGNPGDTLQLTATISPANVTLDRVLWRSTNPAVATVDNNGLVTIHNFRPSDEAMARAAEEGICQIIATTLYDESPMAVVNIDVLTTSIEYVNSEDMSGGSSADLNQNDIFTLQGVCLKRQASQEDIDALAPGIYIIGGKKVVVKN